MSSWQEVWKRTLRAALVYAVLLAVWPLVKLVYRPLFQAAGEFLLGVAQPLGGDIRVLLDPSADEVLAHDTPHMDTVVRLHPLRYAGEDSLAAASSFFHGYQPTAVLLALFAGATSLPWAARRRRLLWALLGLHGFIALRLFVVVFYTYAKSRVDGRPVVELSAFASRCLFWLWHFTWAEPIATYVVPLALWALLVVGRRPLDDRE